MGSYLTPLTLYEKFAGGANSKCCYRLLQLRLLSISLIRIKGIQMGDHEAKIVHFVDYEIKIVHFYS